MTVPTSYSINVSFLDEGAYLVQVQGDPYPLGIYKESGFDLDHLLGEAKDALVAARNKVVGS